MSLVTVHELVKGAEQLEIAVLEDYIQKILQIRAKKVASSFEQEEGDLLQKINVGLSEEKQQRKKELWQKREAEKLTKSEYQELMVLIDEAEALNVQRVIHIGQLAQLRGVTPIQLMEDLGIKAKAYE